MSRVALAKIRSLTLHKGQLTSSRRLPPVKQLTCVGKACDLYQPEVVRCYNEGGEGTEIDWVCKADLPEKLRFGRIDVSCEGWDRPGDPFVLKGSCGLEYRLVQIEEGSTWNFKNYLTADALVTALTFVLTAFILLLVVYILFEPCFRRYISPFFGSGNNPRQPPRPPRPGWFGSHSYDEPPPPPYTASPRPPPKPGPSSSAQSGENSGLFGNLPGGFWTGLGLGGLGATLAHRFYRRDDEQYRHPLRPVGEYDWERERFRRPGMFSSFPYFASSSVSAPSNEPRNRRGDDRRSGSSNLGAMRSTTGYGTSTVR